MASPESQKPAPEPITVADLFHQTVQRLMQDNVEFLLSASLGDRRNVEVLHLIDPKPQPRVRLGYHCVYESFDSQNQATTYGIYLANPWRRPSYEPKPQSRHYFDGAKGLVVREDNRDDRQFEFLRGSAQLLEASGPEYAAALATLMDDLERVEDSTPIRPLSLVFDQFARLK